MSEHTPAGSSQTPANKTTAVHKKKSNVGVNIMIAFFSLVLLAGIGVLCYPTFADWWNRMHQSRAVATYIEATEDLSKEKKAAMLEQAHQYNQDLLNVSDRWHLTDDQLATYNNTLDVTGTGIMGYVSIPKIKVQLPVYHGTSETVLQIAIGHLTGSSLPVGGENTHAVASGHTGLPSARLLTGLDQMEVGDNFYVTVLDEQHWYQVSEINVVLPTEMSKLDIENGKDYMTLVTCTPYGVNSHRLLVRGHAIPAPQTVDETKYDNPKTMMAITIAAIALVFILLVLLAVWLIRRRAKARARLTGVKHRKDNES